MGAGPGVAWPKSRHLGCEPAALAITGGRSLLRVIPARLISLLAAAAMAVMAALSVVAAISA